MLRFPNSFVGYYSTSQDVEIISDYDVPDSIAQLLTANNGGGIHVWRGSDNQVMASVTKWSHSMIQPVFDGTFEERDRRVILRGRIGVPLGTRILLGTFWLLLFLFGPFNLGKLLWGAQGLSKNCWLALLSLSWVLAVVCLSRRNDPEKILTHLTHALTRPAPATAPLRPRPD